MRSQPPIVGFNLRLKSAPPDGSQPVIEEVRLRIDSEGKHIKICLKYKARYSRKKVAAAEYRLVLGLLGLSQLAAARLLGITGRSSQRYACAKHPIPEKVMSELWSWAWAIARRPEEDQPYAYAALRILTRESNQERRYFAAQDPMEAIDAFFSEALQRSHPSVSGR